MNQFTSPSAPRALDEKACADDAAISTQSKSEIAERESSPNTSGGRLKWLLAAGLALLAMAVFFPVVKNGFVAWDDGHNIYENPHLGVGWDNLKWMFTNYDYAHRYLPLGWLSYSVDRALFGGGPLSYHVGNLLFHALDTVLVFMLLRWLLALSIQRKAGRSLVQGTTPFAPGSAVEFAAALGAMWWAVNPLRVEAIAWASGRLYGVAIAFMLLSLLCYLRAAEKQGNGRNRWLPLAVLFYALSLFTYPIALGGLVVFLALDVYPLRRLPLNPFGWFASDTRRIVAEKLLFLVPGALMFAITLWTRSTNTTLGAVFDTSHASIVERAMQAFYVWSYYVWKPWAPFHLAPEYSTLLDFNPWSLPFLISAALVLGLTVWFWTQRKARPALLLIWVCHLALLVPVLGMESFRHYHTTDRYSYLQGLCWSVVLAGAALWTAQRPRWRATFAFALIGWVGFCAVLIPSQIEIWKDSVSLHSRIVASLGRNPDRKSGSRALRDWARHETFLGQLQMEKKDSAAAETSLRHAIEIDPSLPAPSVSLGQLLASQGRTAEAVTCLETVLQKHPDEVRGRIMLAVILGQDGNLTESARRFEEVLRLAPDDAGAHHNFAVTLERLGNTNAAATHYARASELRAPIASH